MRKLIPLTIVIAIAGALAAGVATSGAATTATTGSTCTATNYNPTPNNLSGVYFVSDQVPAPFGNGVESGTYTVDPQHRLPGREQSRVRSRTGS